MAPYRTGLFLDLDGTLANSLTVMKDAYVAFLARFGKAASDVEFERLNGPRLEEIVTILAKTHRLSFPERELLAVYKGIISAAYSDVPPSEGARELLAAARSLGRRVGVVTSNSASLTWDWLENVELKDMVDTIVAADDVERGKPHPEPYLLALAKTECQAKGSLAIEDSPTGAQAAMAAGIETLFLSKFKEGVPVGASAISTLRCARSILDPDRSR